MLLLYRALCTVFTTPSLLVYQKLPPGCELAPLLPLPAVLWSSRAAHFPEQRALQVQVLGGLSVTLVKTGTHCHLALHRLLLFSEFN